MNAFFDSVRRGQIQAVDAALKSSALAAGSVVGEPTAVNKNDHTIRLGDLLTSTDASGWTAFHVACFTGRVEILKQLYDAALRHDATAYGEQAGAITGERTDDFRDASNAVRPSAAAAHVCGGWNVPTQGGHCMAARLLLQPTGDTGTTVVMMAAGQAKPSLLAWLVDCAGQHPGLLRFVLAEQADKGGNTTLHYAAQYKLAAAFGEGRFVPTDTHLDVLLLVTAAIFTRAETSGPISIAVPNPEGETVAVAAADTLRTLLNHANDLGHTPLQWLRATMPAVDDLLLQVAATDTTRTAAGGVRRGGGALWEHADRGKFLATVKALRSLPWGVADVSPSAVRAGEPSAAAISLQETVASWIPALQLVLAQRQALVDELKRERDAAVAAVESSGGKGSLAAKAAKHGLSAEQLRAMMEAVTPPAAASSEAPPQPAIATNPVGPAAVGTFVDPSGGKCPYFQPGGKGYAQSAAAQPSPPPAAAVPSSHGAVDPSNGKCPFFQPGGKGYQQAAYAAVAQATGGRCPVIHGGPTSFMFLAGLLIGVVIGQWSARRTTA